MPETRTVAELVKELRSKRGESLRAAARELDVDPAYLSRVESGQKPVSSTLRERISDHYEVDPDILTLASGSVPNDILQILRANPGLLDDLRRQYG